LRVALSVAAALAQSKDWNKEFQNLLEEPDIESKFTRLRHLGNDFVYVGTFLNHQFQNILPCG
jgi:hypothetical protein